MACAPPWAQLTICWTLYVTIKYCLTTQIFGLLILFWTPIFYAFLLLLILLFAIFPLKEIVLMQCQHDVQNEYLSF